MKRIFLGLLVLIAMFLAGSATASTGTTVYVSTLGNDTTGTGSLSLPFKSITKGMSIAVSGDTVSVASGTYSVGNTAESFPISLKSGVILQGAGVLTTTIQGNASASVVSASTVDAVAKIDGFTISGGGNTTYGGGIYCWSSSPIISNNVITGNNASYGGGIGTNSSSPTISNNVISGNAAVNEGGGIYCNSSSPAISNNTITVNDADYGGGIFCVSSSPTIDTNIISGNDTTGNGGGIYCYVSPSVISNNTVTANTADIHGGGIYCEYASPSISNNKISGNIAVNSGGGIECYLSSSPNISNNTITGNSGFYGGGIGCNYDSVATISDNTISSNTANFGGGIECWDAAPAILDNTIHGNTALYGGGGIRCAVSSNPVITRNTISGNEVSNSDGGGVRVDSSSPAISNNVIIDNAAINGGGVCVDGTASPAILNNTITGNTATVDGCGLYKDETSSPTIYNAIIWGNNGGEDLYGCSAAYSCIGTGTDPLGTGSFSANPGFVNIAMGDYHLLPTSPCINSGTAIGVVGDKDGVARPQGLGYDVGAYEHVDLTAPTGSISINSGAEYSTSATVVLQFSAADTGGSGIHEMRFSNNGGNWGDWVDFAPSVTGYALSSNEGPKTVFVQYRDAANNESLPATASITLDTTAPTGAIFINSTDIYSASSTVTLTMSASDIGGSGLGEMMLSNDGMFDTETWEPYATSKLNWVLLTGNGSRFVYVQYRDNAGNISSNYLDGIIVDTVHPTGTVTINSGAGYASSSIVTLNLTAADTGGSGLYQMRLSNDGVFDTEPWENNTSNTATRNVWNLGAGAGTKTVYVQFRDTALNVSSTTSDSIKIVVGGCPVLTQPVDEAECAWGPLSFSWDKSLVSDATGYAIELCSKNPDTNGEANNAVASKYRIGASVLPSGASTTYPGSTVGLSGTYYWRIIAIKNGQLYGVFSDARAFTVTAPRPALTAPANAAATAQGPLAFSWTFSAGSAGSATGYAIELCSQNPDTHNEANNGVASIYRIGASILPSGASLTYPGSTEGLSGTYYWRIIAIKNGQLFGVFSNARSFTVTPKKPVLSAPANEAIVAKNSPLSFKWTFTAPANGPATGYAIELLSRAPAAGEANNRAASIYRIGASILPSGSSTTYPGSTAGLSGTYYWRIIAIKDGQLYGVFSDARSFIVQ